MVREVSDERLYEFASAVVDAFEKSALESGSRPGILAVANGPLDSLDLMCAQSQRALGGVKNARNTVAGRPGIINPQEEEPDPLNAPGRGFSEGNEESGEQGDLSLEVQHNIEFDADLNDVLNSTGMSIGGRDLGDYLAECFGCDLRLQFDWQLKPINLLAPINMMLDQIARILGNIKAAINPLNALNGVCQLLNALKGLCLPDLIIVLGSLKLLFKKYLQSTVQIRLDWTTVLGPLLKVIIQSISSLLDNIVAVMLAPLDCAIGSLHTANQLERELRDLAVQASTFFNNINEDVQAIKSGELPDNVEFSGLTKDISWGANTVGDTEYPDAPTPGRTSVLARDEFGPSEADGDLSVPVGFTLRKDMTVIDALRHPDFANATMIEKLILPVQEARLYIEDLLSMVLKSIRSLEGLVGGGIELQVNGLLAMLFVTDMISLVVMIIKMIAGNRGVEDWCQHLEENPGLLEDGLRARFGSDVRVDPSDDNRSLVLSKGPELVGEIKLCSGNRTQADNELLNQWINDLNRLKGS